MSLSGVYASINGVLGSSESYAPKTTKPRSKPKTMALPQPKPKPKAPRKPAKSKRVRH